MITNCNRSWSKKLSELKHLFDAEEVDKQLKNEDSIIYNVYEHEIPKRKGHFISLTTVINPGKIGEDFFMIEGFEHKNVSSAEVLLCLFGKGYVLMQPEFGKNKIINIKKGSICYIPPYWSYRVVNNSDEALSFYCTFSAYSTYYSSKLSKPNKEL